MRPTLISFILLCACTNNKLATGEKVDSKPDTLSNTDISPADEKTQALETFAPNPNNDDSLIYIGPISVFKETQEFYTPVYFHDGVDTENIHDYLRNKTDSAVYEGEEEKRSRLPFDIAKRFFRLGGLERISVYDKKSKLLTDARLVRIEHYETLIEGGYIAVFKPSLSSGFSGDAGYCVTATDQQQGIKIDFEVIEDEELTKTLLEKLNIEKSNVWLVDHTRILPYNSIYTSIGLNGSSLLVESRDNQFTVLKEIKDNYSFLGILPTHFDVNGKPVLLARMGEPETDNMWTSLAVFSNGQYEFISGSRLNPNDK
jgi:hypothetical protein